MGKPLCTVMILTSSFYAWLMTATGIQLTQYRPAFSGLVGDAQPYVLAGLVHIAITYFYLRLSSPTLMNRREMVAMLSAAPLVFIFVGWSVFMSSYSIMYERRSETARVESSNELQMISDDMRQIDRQMVSNFASTLTNLSQRMENEILRPEPGVKQGCGPRCREIRSAQTDFQNYQHLLTPLFVSATISADLGKVLGSLEGELQQVEARFADFDAALIKFGRLNALLAERVAPVEEVSSRLSAQFRIQIERLRVKLTNLRGNERNLTDAKYRGLTELVNDVSTAITSGQIARLLDLFTVILIAVAPDFLCLIVALLSRSLTNKTEIDAEEKHDKVEKKESESIVQWGKRQIVGTPEPIPLRDVKAMLMAHMKESAPPPPLNIAVAPPPPPIDSAAVAIGMASAKAPLNKPPTEAETIYDRLNKIEFTGTSRRRVRLVHDGD